jgi:broad specificity phosphatase PhoE
MKIILTRHGRTNENAKKILQGHMQSGLSAEGIQQAKKLARRLKNEKIDIIYSSDLKRAADTAKEIVKYHKNIPVYFVEELRERNLGSLQGMNVGSVNWKKIPKNVETLVAMKKRMKIFLAKIHKKHPRENVLLVSHGGIGRSLLAAIRNMSAKSIFEMPKMKNTAVYVIEIDEKAKGTVVLENCTKHL